MFRFLILFQTPKNIYSSVIFVSRAINFSVNLSQVFSLFLIFCILFAAVGPFDL